MENTSHFLQCCTNLENLSLLRQRFVELVVETVARTRQIGIEQSEFSIFP